MNTSPNRVVAIGTPLIFAPLAGIIATQAAQIAPGADLNAGQIEAVFIAGATVAIAKAALWMKGWQDHEKRQDAMSGDSLESPNEMAFDDGDELDLDEGEGEGEIVDGDVDIDVEDLDDEMAEFEAAIAEDDAVTAQEV